MSTHNWLFVQKDQAEMCVNQKCLPVGSLVADGSNPKGCLRGCNGNGVCNSKSHCHCHKGFAPPFCIYAGPGGSEDSGPASDPNAGRKMVTLLYVIFLGIIPVIAINVILLYYARPCLKRWWEKGGGFGLGERRVGDGVGGSQYVKPDCCCSKWTFSWEKSKRGGAGGLRVLVEPSSSMSPSSGSGDSATSTLLPNGQEMLNTNLRGQFKRFSISPSKIPPSPNGILIQGANPESSSPSSNLNSAVLPTRSAPPPPTTAPSAGVINPPMTSPVSSATHPGGKRPVISDPILDMSSTTAKELISSAMGGEEGKVQTVDALKPQRKAPEAPPPIQPRPLSFPVGLKASEPAPGAHEVTPMVVTTSGISNTGGGSGGPSALSRIASILRPSQVGRSQSRGSRDMSGQGGPKGGVKAAKVLDRQALRNLSISNPIPQQEIEIPQKVLPVSEAAAAASLVGGKPTVTRAQSMRDPKVTTRPNIHTFGSMRGTRPASIPSASSIGTRPTSPPPRPPSPNPHPAALSDKTHTIPGLPGYQNPPPSKPEHAYDDCMSLKPVEEGRGVAPPPPAAPLAHIEEEDSSTSPTSGDNIYAVIQEVEDVCDVGKSPSLNLNPTNSSYTSPTASDYQSPRPLEGSCESVGLLSEIVSEIQARNIESIYTSTLGRKKKQEEKERKEREEAEAKGILSTGAAKDATGKPEKSVSFKMDKVVENKNLQGTYVNTPCTTTSSFQPSSSTFYSNVGNTGLPNSTAPATLPPKTIRSPPALTSSLAARPSVSASLMKNNAKASNQPPATTTRAPSAVTNTTPAIVSTPLPAIPMAKATPTTSTITSTKAVVPPRPAQLPVRPPPNSVSSVAANNTSSEKEGAISALASKTPLSPKSVDAAKKEGSSNKTTPEQGNKGSANVKGGETSFSTFKGPLRTLATSPATTTLTSVPSYKPYSSSLQRSGGTVSSYRSASTPSSSTATTPVSSAPSVSSPPPSTAAGAKSPPTENNIENNRGIGSVNSGITSPSTSKGPDLVTSSIRSFESASNIGKSPDVLIGAAGKGTVPNRQQQPRPAPKPNLPASNRGVRAGVEIGKGGPGISSRGSAPSAPGNRAVGNTKPPVVSSRPSHVASLQQKFESSTESNTGGKVAPKTEVMPHRTAPSATIVSQKRPVPLSASSKLESLGKGGGIKK
ncbi:mucin-2-like [Hetaerina americana]|uniref:mucin-2-like n=1 Tax=Hetaerina americana TaxID=62018 RepID=UPI003A7F4B42